MAETLIKIKRSGTSGNPAKLHVGELAYSWSAGEGGNRLYIGTGVETDGNAANHAVIGGTFFTDMLDHQAGVLTASSAIIVDADKKIDELKTPKISNDGVLTIEGTKTVLKNAYIGDDTTTIEQYVDSRIQGAHVTIAEGTGIGVKVEGLTTTVSIKDTGVTAGTVGSATKIPVLTINAQGQVTATSEEQISTTLSLGDGAQGTGSVDLLTGKLEVAAGTGVKVALSGGKFTVSADDSVMASKTYVDGQDEAMLEAAKADATTKANGALEAAKTFATEEDVKVKDAAAADATTKAGKALEDAKKYTDEQIPQVITSKVGNQLQAWSAQLDKVAALATEGLVKRNADGTWATNNSAVTAGSYTKVTVDADGIVTAGENPTTLAGYGITDAVHKSGETLTGKLTYSGVGIDDFADKDLVSKEYVDRVASGHIPHKACVTGTQENVAGTYSNGTAGVGATFTTTVKTISGVTLSQGDRVILLGQTDKTQNGVYEVTSIGSSVVMTRAEDMNGNPAEEIYQGSSFLIIDGSMQGTIWSLINKSVTFGTTEIEFAQTAAPNVYTAGSGIDISANTVSVKQGATVKVIGGNLEVASGTGNNGKFLKAGADGDAASWAKIQVSDTEGTVPVNRGGTGAVSLNANELVLGNGTDAVKQVAKAEGVLIGSATDAPVFGQADLTKHVQGVLPAANGGTGVANSNTLTLTGGNVAFTMQGATAVTLPTTGTLATLAGAETLSNKTIEAVTVDVSATTESTSAATGALTVAGGAGIAKNLNVGGNLVGSGTSVLEGFTIDAGVY